MAGGSGDHNHNFSFVELRIHSVALTLRRV
jgi:hypothetical protein